MPHDEDIEKCAGAALPAVVQIARDPGVLELCLIPFFSARNDMTYKVLSFLSLEDLIRVRAVSVGFYFLANQVLATLLKLHTVNASRLRVRLFVHWDGFTKTAQGAFQHLHQQARSRCSILPFPDDALDVSLLNRKFAHSHFGNRLPEKIQEEVLSMKAQELAVWVNHLGRDQKLDDEAPVARLKRLQAYRAAIGELPPGLILAAEWLIDPADWSFDLEFDAVETVQLLGDRREYLPESWQRAFLAEHAEFPVGAPLAAQWQSLIDFTHKHRVAQTASNTSSEAPHVAVAPDDIDLLPGLAPAEQQSLLDELYVQAISFNRKSMIMAPQYSASFGASLSSINCCKALLGLDHRFVGKQFDILAGLGEVRVSNLLIRARSALADVEYASDYARVDYLYLASLYVTFASMRGDIERFFARALGCDLLRQGFAVLRASTFAVIERAGSDEQHAATVDLFMRLCDELICVWRRQGVVVGDDYDSEADAKRYLSDWFKDRFRKDLDCWQSLPQLQCRRVKDFIFRLFPTAIDCSELSPFLVGLFSCANIAEPEEIQALANQLFVAFDPHAGVHGNDREFDTVEIIQFIGHLAPQLTPNMLLEALLTAFKVKADSAEFWPKFKVFFLCESAEAHFFMADVLNQIWLLLNEGQQQVILAESDLDNLAFCFTQGCLKFETMLAKLPRLTDEEEAGRAASPLPPDGALSAAGMHTLLPSEDEGGAPAPPAGLKPS